MTFTTFWAECVPMFGIRSTKPSQTPVSTDVMKTTLSVADQPVKSGNLLYREKKKQ